MTSKKANNAVFATIQIALLFAPLRQLQGKADDQLNWKVSQSEKLTNLKEKLRRSKDNWLKVFCDAFSLVLLLWKESHGKARKVLSQPYMHTELGAFSEFQMAITSERLHKQSVVIKQICKLFPNVMVIFFFYKTFDIANLVHLEGEEGDGSSGQYDQICNARLPRGLDPHSVPSEELAASLGDLAPGYGNGILIGMHALLLEAMSTRFLYHAKIIAPLPAIIHGQRKALVILALLPWNLREDLSWIQEIASIILLPLHTLLKHKDLQKGISLLKKSVACITSYCYNSLCLDVPTEASTFEAFSKLLATLSSTKEVRSVFSLKMACSRSGKQAQQLNKSVWNVNSPMSSSALLEKKLLRSQPSEFGCQFSFANEMSVNRKNESLIDEWDIVEHPKFPPPPSETEDVEHWTRAMFIDATRTRTKR
ncbi:DNA-directed RNA polymerase II protein isoform 2 [Hibiscus syriacus]|uniref:DNA-directed RNA polymerase II protein isoform 2 n=1 Tax=Hibiscus syriacus TaxID=106335 RepID=A0A6A3CB10_HIBSY|nr:DNA-directed RNA polymerase II protein isoform 2 [Hibiscus syriacus]